MQTIAERKALEASNRDAVTSVRFANAEGTQILFNFGPHHSGASAFPIAESSEALDQVAAWLKAGNKPAPFVSPTKPKAKTKDEAIDEVFAERGIAKADVKAWLAK